MKPLITDVDRQMEDKLDRDEMRSYGHTCVITKEINCLACDDEMEWQMEVDAR